MADLLRANGFTSRQQAIAGSFRLPLVRELHDYAPEIAASILVGPVLPAAELISASYVHLCWRDKADQPHRLVTRDLLDRLHAAGLGVVLWNEERPSEIAALSTLDVQAICGNAPDLL